MALNKVDNDHFMMVRLWNNMKVGKCIYLFIHSFLGELFLRSRLTFYRLLIILNIGLPIHQTETLLLPWKIMAEAS